VQVKIQTRKTRVYRHPKPGFSGSVKPGLETLAWNSLSDDLRDPTISTNSFRRLLTRLFQSTSALEVSHIMRYINLRLTYLHW